MNNIKLRDYIATAAMQILLEKFEPSQYNINHIVKDAYTIADAMILEAAKWPVKIVPIGEQPLLLVVDSATATHHDHLTQS